MLVIGHTNTKSPKWCGKPLCEGEAEETDSRNLASSTGLDKEASRVT